MIESETQRLSNDLVDLVFDFDLNRAHGAKAESNLRWKLISMHEFVDQRAK